MATTLSVEFAGGAAPYQVLNNDGALTGGPQPNGTFAADGRNYTRQWYNFARDETTYWVREGHARRLRNGCRVLFLPPLVTV